MKRMIALFTVFFCLAALLAGCGGNPAGSTGAGASASASDSSGAVSGDAGEIAYGPLSGSIIGMLNNEDFTMKIRTTVPAEGQEVTTEMTLAQQLPNYAMEMSAMGEVMRIIMKDGAVMMVSDSQKLAYDLAVMGLDPSAYEVPEVASAVAYLGEGTGTVGGKELPYEEYDAGEGARARYYFDGGKLAYIVSITGSEEVAMEILDLAGGVDEAIFAIPGDYRVVESMEELAAAMAA